MTPPVPADRSSGVRPPSRRQQIRTLVIQDQLSSALSTLLGFPEFTSLQQQDDLVLLQSRLNALEVDHRRQTVTSEEYAAQRQQIREGILNAAGNIFEPHPIQPSTTSVSAEDAKVRARYLKDLRQHIENLQRASIHNAVFLDLGVDDSPSAAGFWVFRNAEDSKELVSIDEAFDTYEGRLLILGSPGGGKTTMLLHLALRLITAAEQNPAAPVPLMVNLSKFRLEAHETPLLMRRLPWMIGESRGRPFDRWLIGEFENLYKIKRSTAERWIDNHQIAALLDGLDEVNDERRAAVARLLNTTYLQQHPDSVVVVCSRTAEYQPLLSEKANRLELRGAVTLQALSSSQIGLYLERASATGLREALRRDAALYELALSPLTLSMMTLAYGKLTAAEISSITPTASGADQRHHLMQYFVSRMLQREERKKRSIPFDNDKTHEIPEKDYPYSRAKVNRYLSWLAIQLSIRMQTACSLNRLFSFFDRKTDGGGLGAPTWAVAVSKSLYVFLLISFSTLPLMLRDEPRMRLALVVTAAALAVYLPVSVFSQNSQSDRITASMIIWHIILSIGAFTLISRAFHAILPFAATSIPFGIVLASVVCWFFILCMSTPEERSVARTILIWNLALTAVAIAATFALLPVRHWIAEIVAGGALVGNLVVIVVLFQTDSTNDFHAWPDLAIISGLYCAVYAFYSGWVWLAGPVRPIEAIPTIALLFAALLTYNSQAVSSLTLVALFTAAGAWAAGLDGALLGGAASGLVSLLLAALRDQKQLPKWIDGLTQSSANTISGPIEHHVLSKICLLFAVTGRRLPVRFASFVAYTSRALLLKPAPGEIEFVHRRLRDYFALRELIPKLQEHDPVSRLDSIRALGYQGAASIDPLTEILSIGTAGERAAAIMALGRISSPEIAQLLEAALGDAEPEVRAAAVRGIRKLGGDTRLRLLQRAADDHAPGVRMAVLEAAVSADLRKDAETLVSALVAGAVSDPDLLRACIAQMSSTLCRFFGSKLPPQAKATLVAFLSDPQASIRANVSLMMAGGRHLADYDRIAGLLSDEEPTVRAAAAEAIGQLDYRPAVPRLIDLLTDSDETVRTKAAWSLRWLPAPEASAALRTAIRDRKPNVRAEAVRALGASAGHSAAQEVVARLHDRNRSVRIAAAETAGDRKYAKARGQLVKLLRSWSAPERAAAAGALGKLGELESLTPLLKALSDRNVKVRSSTVRALGQLGRPDAVQALIHKHQTEIESEVKSAIFDALAALHDPISQQWVARNR